MELNQITYYHIHIYYSETTMALAKEIGHEASKKLGLALGHFHDRNVGPHPRWSVQLSVPVEKFSVAMGWFCLNRQGLTIFTHPNTGFDLEDHRDHAIWMGECLELYLGIFK